MSSVPTANAQEPGLAVSALVAVLGERLAQARHRAIGFPVARDIDFSPVLALHEGLVNNIGDPETRGGRWPGHTHDVERDIVAFFVELFGGTRRSSWGYVSGGGSSEGVLHGMWLGREHHPAGRVYHSTAAHYCVAKAARMLGLAASPVAVDQGGAMDLDALARSVLPHRDRPVVVVATLGTTMTEAVDDVPGIHAVLDAVGVPGRHVVVDAALSGPALALDGPAAELLVPRGRPGDRLGGHVGADSVCFSTHKSFGTPHVGGVVLTRREHVARIAQPVDYVASLDLTVGGSRSGQTAVELRHALDSIGGLDRQRARTHAAREVAEYAVTALRTAGWAAWRHPHAWTVVLDTPPATEIALRWGLPVSEGRAHLICAPGVDRAQVDEFVADLTTHPATTPPRRNS